MVQQPARPRARQVAKTKSNEANEKRPSVQVADDKDFDIADCWNDETADAFGRALGAHGLHDVKAFALLTLHNGNDIAVRTSSNIKQFGSGIASKHIRQNLRHVYEEAASVSEDHQASTPCPNPVDSAQTTEKLAVRTVKTRNENGQDLDLEQRPLRASTTTRESQHCHQRGRNAHRDGGLEPSNPNPSDATPMVHLRLGDTAEVKAQLEHRLRNLHQVPVKKIAKAWIKAICPKKQAKFPYQNNAHEKTTGQPPPIPMWWPDKEVCPYKEPDHIHRDQRIPLCLHLLRLRPTPEQLKQWNNDKPNSEPHPTHVREGWTAFLKEHAYTQVMDDLREGTRTPEQAARRLKLLEEMYEIAEREESALSRDPGYDLSHVFIVEDAAAKSRKKALMKRKRSRAVSTVSDLTSGELGSTSTTRQSKRLKGGVESLALSETTDDMDDRNDIDVADEKPTTSPYSEPTKYAEHSTTTQQSHIEHHGADESIHNRGPSTRATTYPSTAPLDTRVIQQPAHLSHHPEHVVFQGRTLGGMNNGPYALIEDSSSNTSFNTNSSSNNSFRSTSVFPGQQQYDYHRGITTNRLPHNKDVLVNYMGQHTQPQWDTVPNTPMCSPSDLMQLPFCPLESSNDFGNGMFGSQSQVQRGQSFIDPMNLNVDDLKYEDNGHLHSQGLHEAQPDYTMNMMAFDQDNTYPAFYPNMAQPNPHGLPSVFQDSQPQADFQAPARVLRPFTGHSAGVGGGAWT